MAGELTLSQLKDTCTRVPVFRQQSLIIRALSLIHAGKKRRKWILLPKRPVGFHFVDIIFLGQRVNAKNMSCQDPSIYLGVYCVSGSACVTLSGTEGSTYCWSWYYLC